MAYYQDTPAPYVGPTRDAWADQYKNLQLLLPIMAQEEEEKRQNAAARSKFAGNLVDLLREPVKQELQPTYGSIAPQIAGDYGTIAPQVALTPGQAPVVGGGAPERPSALPLAPTVNPALTAAMQGAMQAPVSYTPGSPGVPATIDVSGANIVPDTLMNRPFHGSGQPFSPVGPAQPQLYPQNAAEMALFAKLAPYITQRRSTEEAYRRGIGEAVVKGNYGRDRTAANDATKLAQAMLALKRPRGSGSGADQFWRRYVPDVQVKAQQYLGNQNLLSKFTEDGWAHAPVGSPERTRYDNLFVEQQGLAQDLFQAQQHYAQVVGAPGRVAPPDAQSKSAAPQSEELDFKPLR